MREDIKKKINSQIMCNTQNPLHKNIKVKMQK